MKRIFILILVLVAFSRGVIAQQKSNLEQTFILVDRCAKNILDESSGNEFRLVFNSPKEYEILKTRVLNNFALNINDSSETTLMFTVTNASVHYGEMFRDWFLGDFKIERKIKFAADYAVKDKGKIVLADSFNETIKDTVLYSELNGLENSSLPFTKGNIPEKPFYNGLLEPIVAVTSVVIAVYLLFTVRSK